ncbi:restriction endonuclease PLD domain-containing protein [Thermodesulfovibrio sp. TK110]
MNLFENREEGFIQKETLSIFFNNKKCSDSLREFFNPQKFDSIEVVTYVSSPRFFFETLKGFKRILLILGIDDDTILTNFSPELQEKFLKDLDEETQKRVALGQIEVRYSPIGYRIHSKIYRLSKDNFSVVFVGSANFTQSAFEGKQFEELVGYDSLFNPIWCQYYSERIKTIYEKSIDFIPLSLKEKILKSGKITLILPEESLNIVKEIAEELREHSPLIPLKEIKERVENLENSIKKKDEEIRIIRKERELIDLIIKRKERDGRGIILPKIEIEKQKDKIMQILTKRRVVKGEFEDQRIELRWDDGHLIAIRGEWSERFGRPASVQVIREKLQILDRFIKSYEIFTSREDKQTLKRVFEVILYAFMSPFLWLIRKQLKDRAELLYKIPVFLLIAGKANTGKTHLLRFISLATGNNEQYYHYHSRTTISSYREIPPQIIEEFLRDENLCPIFVDEIDRAYFSSKNISKPFMGESFIKEVSNTLIGQHPTVISTTNTTFQSDAQVIKRIYYIQLNNSFDLTRESEALKHFEEIRESFETVIFRDFIFRLEEVIKENGLNMEGDFLSAGRKIFRAYFEETETPLPSWFNQEPLRDYYERGKNIWRMLYMRKKEIFEEIPRDDKIVVNLELDKKEREDYLLYLPPEVVIEDKGLLILNRERFFEFIEEKPKKIKDFFKKLGFSK